MNDRAILPEPAERLLVEDLVPEFRVVVYNGQRRGLRLERGFWEALKAIAANRKCTLGALVDSIATEAGDSSNLSSAIRVACLQDIDRDSTALRRLASIETVKSILQACPAPAFALESNRKILTFNPPFQNLVRRQLPAGLDDDARKDFKLALDLSLAEIFQLLCESVDRPVSTGFVIGAGERRYRGQINAARAPVAELELIMAFVVDS